MSIPSDPISDGASSDDLTEDKALLSEEAMIKPPNLTRQNTWIRGFILTCLNSFLFLGSLILFITSKSNHSLQGRNACLKETSTYSPVFEEVDLRLTDTSFNGSLYVGDDPSVWRGAPDDPDTSAAWESFEHVRPIPLTSAQIRAMGKDPSTVAKFEDDYWGFGDDAYIGALDFFHQIHCLNELRKEAFSEYGRAGDTVEDHSGLFWIHLRHCTDMLMQHMLCNADAGFLTYNWMEHNPHPFPDMSVEKRCRDWTQLVEYRDSHGVDVEKYKAIKKPDGVLELKQSKDRWKYFPQGGDSHGNEHRDHRV